MFEKDKIYITELQSVIYVTPSLTHKKRVRYGPNIPRYELIYKISGESYTTYNGKTMHNLPGTVEFLPKCNNADYYVDRIEPGDCIDIFFDTDFPLPTEACVINCSANKKVGTLFNKIYNIWISKSDGYYYNCMAIFYEIIYELSKLFGNYISQDNYIKIKKGVEYLHTHCYDKDIDYYIPAKLCNISYTYFKKIFFKKYNVTPIQYVTRLRMERSVELIASGHYSVTEVAKMCGFDNVYYFSKKFKDFYGISPKNYKPFN